jgi:hypothetical protein
VDDVTSASGEPDQAPDLSVLEAIEGELFAVERALEQIDQGVYEGFAGLDGHVPVQPSPPSSETSMASRNP